MNMEKRIQILEVEAAFQSAFDQLGGAEAFIQWARSYPTDFKKVLSQYFPADLFKTAEQQHEITLGELLSRAKREGN